MTRSTKEIETAIAEVAATLHPGYDRAYFETHEQRFRRCAARLLELVPRQSRILDIGSHYSHQGAILSCLGYEVWGLDVPVFHNIEWVRDRQERHHITSVSVERIDEGAFLPDKVQYFAAILFCEILEHITFNPIRFWSRVHELMAVNGIIYLTTPNSLQAMSVLSALKRLLFLEGIGPSIPTIFGTVTYGHHWKEYSKREIVRYFSDLSSDFDVSVTPWAYQRHDSSGLRDRARNAVRKLGNVTRVFAEDLEAVVVKKGSTGIRIVPPAYA